MSEELKPCPRCGSPAKYYTSSRAICCTVPQCNCWHTDEDVWNTLPRALVWTTEPPKAEGFYWAERKNTNSLHVVRVMEIREDLSVFMPGSEIDGYLHWYVQWAGPIPEPQESKS